MTALPALAVIEMGSLSRAYLVLDAVVKKAPVTVAQYAEVTPGKTILVIVGEVSPVEESAEEGRVVAAEALLDHLVLPGVHPAVVAMVLGRPIPPEVDALAVLETATACAAVRAADAGMKAADVGLLKVKLAAGIGGKGLVLWSGPLPEVEAALAAAEEAAGEGLTVGREVIARPHPEVVGRFTS
jgi:microcompartment protein CcmL/EutN